MLGVRPRRPAMIRCPRFAVALRIAARASVVELPVERPGFVEIGELAVLRALFAPRVARCLPELARRFARGFDELAQLARILETGRGFHTARDVDAPRANERDRVTDVVRRETTGKQDAHAA